MGRNAVVVGCLVCGCAGEPAAEPVEAAETSTTGAAEPAGSTGAHTSIGFLSDLDVPERIVECSTWADDCPAGQKCLPWADDGGNAWVATRCAPVQPDPDRVGESCTVVGTVDWGFDSCDQHSMCWGVDRDGGRGRCTEFCRGSDTRPICSDPSATCPISAMWSLPLCFPQCDPLTQDCPDGNSCIGFKTSFICVPDRSQNGAQQGSGCDAPSQCSPGLTCLHAGLVAGCVGSRGCCSPFCNLSDPQNDCRAELGEACLSWHEAGTAPPEYEQVGVCGIPQ